MASTEITLGTHYQACFNYAKFSGQRVKNEKPGERHSRYIAGDPVDVENKSPEEIMAFRKTHGRVQFICRHAATGIHRISSIHAGATVKEMLESNRKSQLRVWETKAKRYTVKMRNLTPLEVMRKLVGPKNIKSLLGFAFRGPPAWEVIDQRPILWDECDLPLKTWNQAFLCRYMLDNFPELYAVKKKQYMGVIIDLKQPQGYRVLESVLEMPSLLPLK